MYKFFIGTCFFYLYSCLVVSAQEVRSFSLDEALDYAMQNNVQVKDEKLQREIALKDVKETTAMGLPQIDAELNFQRFFDIPAVLIPAEFVGGEPGDFIETRFGLKYDLLAKGSVNQLIFDGTYIVGLKAAKTYVDFSNKKIDQVRTETRMTIMETYYACLLSLKNLEIIEKNLNNVSENLKETEKLNEQGFVEALDVDRLTLSQKKLKNELAKMKREVANTHKILKFRMGFPMEDSISLSTSLTDLVDQEQGSSMENNTRSDDEIIQDRVEYKVLMVQKELAKLDLKRYQAGYLPSLNGFFNYQQNAQRNEFNFFDDNQPWFPATILGFSLKVPIFDGLRKSAQTQSARIEIQRVENQQWALEEQIKLEIQQNLQAYQSALESLSFEEESLDLAERIFERAQRKYDNGVGSSLELNSARTDFYSQQSSHLNAVYELLVARMRLDRTLAKF